MALKNLFEMVKADRYTQDGREELIKAQEVETEDKVYNIGDISQKTGLQKTANGWVKPKNGAGRNHGTEQKKRGPGAIHTAGNGSVGIDKMKEAAEKGLKGQELKEFMTGSKSESKPAETPKAPKPSAQEYMKAKQRVKAYEDQYKKDMDDYEYMERIKANGVDPSIFNPMYGGKPKPLEENKSYMEELNKIKTYEAEDAAYTAQSINAPREKQERTLTGDTRIRVRK